MEHERPSTLGELRQTDYRRRSVKTELRENLIARLREGSDVFPGVVGYDQTVLPQIQNAILSVSIFILLGLRGQAKTRLLRALPALLDEAVPAIEGSPLNEDPLAPVTPEMRRRVEQEGDALPITWLLREDRYREKLATPDVTIADLIGDIDPIKAASKKLSFSDPEVIHYGIIPRTNRGIFAINELPDLQARIQVGLLNILEEGDVQIRGFPVRLPLDVAMVFSANPEDYTNRGSIITPLRDRISSQILTHYPRTLEESRRITSQEAWIQRPGGVAVEVPEYLREALEEVAFRAREDDLVDHSSGVSARMTISLMENVLSNAERRAVRKGLERTVARVSNLAAASSAITGRVELVYEGEREGPAAVARHLTGKAVKRVFDARLPDAYRVETAEGGGEFKGVAEHFQGGRTLDLSDELTNVELYERLTRVLGLEAVATKFLGAQGAAEIGAAMEFVLEGLHQSSLLAKDELVGGRVYRDMFEDMVKNLEEPRPRRRADGT